MLEAVHEWEGEADTDDSMEFTGFDAAVEDVLRAIVGADTEAAEYWGIQS